MRGLLGTVVLVACAATVGCGSGSGKKTDGGGGGSGGIGGGTGGTGGTGGGAVTANCGSFTACGGNIVGTWRQVSGCGTIVSATCPTQTTMTTLASGATTTYTFSSGGVFTYMSSGNENETVNYALGCLGGLIDAGAPQACADLQNLFRMTIGQDAGASGTQLLSATCSAGQNQTCDCALVFSTAPTTTQASYTTSGTQVTIIDPDGGAPDANPPLDYCVSGNTLTLRRVDDSGSSVVITLTH
ncbi:MAG TPA: hypothetical protein VN903_40565 [Polyangia bacterium]|nr:hypothetical protein [Polyangia bacterium]